MHTYRVIAALVYGSVTAFLVGSYDSLGYIALSSGTSMTTIHFVSMFMLASALAVFSMTKVAKPEAALVFEALSLLVRFSAMIPERNPLVFALTAIIVLIEGLQLGRGIIWFGVLFFLGAILAAARRSVFAYGQDVAFMPLVSLFALIVLIVVFTLMLLGSKRLVLERDRFAASILQNAETIRRLSDTNAAFQEYTKLVEERSAELERKRITREIHDTVGYAFTNILMMAREAVLIDAMPTGGRMGLGELLDSIGTEARDGLSETRKALRILRSDEGQRRPLMAEVKRIAAVFSRLAGIESSVYISNLPDTVSQPVASAIYRMVQECLTNSLRHGAVSRIWISCWLWDDELVVDISDDGSVGKVIREGIGISGMRERIEDLGGSLRISADEKGFKVRASIPRAVI